MALESHPHSREAVCIGSFGQSDGSIRCVSVYLQSPKTRCACFLISADEPCGGLAHTQQGSHVSWAKVTIRHDGLVASSSVTLGKCLLFLGPNFPIIKMRGLDRVTSKALPSPTHCGCMALNQKVV